MPKAKERDGVYYRKDRGIWCVSYIDASGERVREKVEAHTRQQAIDALRRDKDERGKGAHARSPASQRDHARGLFERYKRHQKARIRPTTFERLGGILDTLKANLPEYGEGDHQADGCRIHRSARRDSETRNRGKGNERAQALPQTGGGVGRVESEPGGWCAAPQTSCGQRRAISLRAN